MKRSKGRIVQSRRKGMVYWIPNYAVSIKS
jgi:hypothetical protein